MRNESKEVDWIKEDDLKEQKEHPILSDSTEEIKIKINEFSAFQSLPVRSTKISNECTELYLANRNIESVKDFHMFPYLKALFLNNNRIQTTLGFQNNFRLKELYLHNNLLETIHPNSFKSLIVLERLTLNNNHIKDLITTLNEIRHINTLKSLDLFHNPIADQSNYRLTTVKYLPSLEILDRKSVTSTEKKLSSKVDFDSKEFIASSSSNIDEKNTVISTNILTDATNDIKDTNDEQNINLFHHSNNENNDLTNEIVTTPMNQFRHDLVQWIRLKRPAVTSYWSNYDRRKTGGVSYDVYIEGLKRYNFDLILSNDMISSLYKKYRILKNIPSISIDKHRTVELFHYFQFCYDFIPPELRSSVLDESVTNSKIYANKKKNMTSASTYSKFFYEYVENIKAKRNANTIHTEDKSKSEFHFPKLIQDDLDNMYKLDPWIMKDVNIIISNKEIEVMPNITLATASDVIFQKDHIYDILREISFLGKVPSAGILNYLEKLFNPKHAFIITISDIPPLLGIKSVDFRYLCRCNLKNNKLLDTIRGSNTSKTTIKKNAKLPMSKSDTSNKPSTTINTNTSNGKDKTIDTTSVKSSNNNTDTVKIVSKTSSKIDNNSKVTDVKDLEKFVIKWRNLKLDEVDESRKKINELISRNMESVYQTLKEPKNSKLIESLPSDLIKNTVHLSIQLQKIK
jgi:hypothetical protein